MMIIIYKTDSDHKYLHESMSSRLSARFVYPSKGMSCVSTMRTSLG